MMCDVSMGGRGSLVSLTCVKFSLDVPTCMRNSSAVQKIFENSHQTRSICTFVSERLRLVDSSLRLCKPPTAEHKVSLFSGPVISFCPSLPPLVCASRKGRLLPGHHVHGRAQHSVGLLRKNTHPGRWTHTKCTMLVHIGTRAAL